MKDKVILTYAEALTQLKEYLKCYEEVLGPDSGLDLPLIGVKNLNRGLTKYREMLAYFENHAPQSGTFVIDDESVYQVSKLQSN